MEVCDRLEGRVTGGVEAGVDAPLQPPSQRGEEQRGASGDGDGDRRTASAQYGAGQDVGGRVHRSSPARMIDLVTVATRARSASKRSGRRTATAIRVGRAR